MDSSGLSDLRSLKLTNNRPTADLGISIELKVI